MAPTRAAMRASSIVPSRIVSDDEPILSTVRTDAAMSGRAAPPSALALSALALSASALSALSASALAALALALAASAAAVIGRRLWSSSQAAVGASGAGHVSAVAGRQVRVPVEDALVALLADQHGVAGARPGLGKGLLDAEPGEPVGEVADRLLVGEVR